MSPWCLSGHGKPSTPANNFHRISSHPTSGQKLAQLRAISFSQLTLTTDNYSSEAYCRAEADYGCVLGSVLGAGIPDVLEVRLHSPPRRNGVVVSRLKNRLATEAWIPL